MQIFLRHKRELTYTEKQKLQKCPIDEKSKMVGATGIEPVTPTV